MSSFLDVCRLAGRTAYRWWMLFAHALGYVNTKLLLTIFYVFVVGPLWLITTLVRHDPLNRRRTTGESYWRVKEPADHSEESSRHLF